MLFTSGLATFLAMGIAGLWHGANWTFVIYGFLHGLYLAINQYWRKKKMPRIPGFLSWALTFTCVLISLIYFGADTVPQASARVLALFNPHGALHYYNIGLMSITGISLKIFGPPMAIGVIAAFFGPSSEQRARDFRPTILNCVYSVVFIVTAFVFINSDIPTPFVYFRF
jgi:hypothetical protein